MPETHKPLETVPGSEGRVIARRYRLLQPLGRGGMGMVWQAHDELLDRPVAVKELLHSFHLDDAGRAAAQRRMLREARSAARLSHPSIVTVHDVVEEDGRPWIVMELLGARSLDRVVRDEGALPVRRVAEIGSAILDGLRHAHAAGVLHRDVKPGNVLITHDRIVLTDFGIAAIEGDVASTQTGTLMGSPAYVPPERLQGRPITPAADLWSIGATLYAAVEGRPPYEGADAMAVLGAIVTQDPTPPRQAGALLPIIQGLMRKDPAERMSAAQVAELLERVLRGAPDGGAVPPGSTASTPPSGSTASTTPPTSGPAGPASAPPPAPEDLPPLDIPSGPLPAKTIETPSGPVRVSLLDALDTPSGPLPSPPSPPASPPSPSPPSSPASDESVSTSAEPPEPEAPRETTGTFDLRPPDMSGLPKDHPPRPAGGTRIQPLSPEPEPAAPRAEPPPGRAPEPDAAPAPAGKEPLAADSATGLRSAGTPRPAPKGRWVRDGRPSPLLAVVATGIVGVALLAWILVPSDGPASDGATPAASPVVPAGFELQQEGNGMMYVVPDDAARTTHPNGLVRFTSKKYNATIEVESAPRTDDGGLDSLASDARNHTFEEYRQLRLSRADLRGWPAAEWEFTYQTYDGVAEHGLKRYISAGGSGVTFTITAHEDSWGKAATMARTMFDSFRPPRR